MTVKEYIAVPENYFWCWEEFGDVLAIEGGNTIAYTEDIEKYMRPLADEGLPLFGAFLLVYISVSSDNSDSLIQCKNKLLTQSLYNTEIEECFSYLEMLSHLPKEIKKKERLGELLLLLFQNCHNKLSVSKSLRIVESLRSISSNFEQYTIDRSPIQKDLKIISLLKRKFPTSESIVQGLQSLPELDRVDEPLLHESKEELSFLESLIENDSTCEIAGVIKFLWSGLNIPFDLISSGEQSFSGVSDISNKGNIGDLLLSEYAYDEEMFLSRLVNNDALYYVKETPPGSNQDERIILIDTSLRSWGIVKTIAHAIAIALNQHPKNQISYKVFLIGEHFIKSDLTTLEGVLSSLSINSISLSCANGLQEFIRSENYNGVETILICEENAIKSSGINLENEWKKEIDIWIHPELSGKTSLFKGIRRKHLNTFTIPIDRELNSARNKSVFIPPEVSYDLPILIPDSAGAKALCPGWEEGVCFKLAKNGALLRSAVSDTLGKPISWEEISKNDNSLKVAPYFTVGHLENGDHIVLTYQHSKRTVYLYNTVTKEIKDFMFEIPDYINESFFTFNIDRFVYHENKKGKIINFNGVENKYFDLDDKSIKRGKKYLEDNKRLKSFSESAPSIIKNLKRVFINKENQLVLSSCRLILNESKEFKLKLTSNIEAKHKAKSIGNGKFVFSENSVVHIDEYGIVSLQSSSKDIPRVFIPALIDKPLGLATKEVFSGNQQYRLLPYFNVLVKSSGVSIISLIKMLEDLTHWELKDIKEKVDNIETQPIFMASVDATRLDELKRKFEEWQVDSEFSTVKGSIQEVQDNQLFFDHKINAFIRNIDENGTIN